MKTINYGLLSLFLICSWNFLVAQNEILSPKQFLGYEIGDQFTYHYKIVDYFEYVAQYSTNAKLEVLGATSENRPLIATIITNKENMKHLDDIRQNNLIAVGLQEGVVSEKWAKPIIWLSYNIHGDEAAGSEAAIQTLYHLVSDKNAAEWLKEMVIIIDPCENPDGHDRYVNWYNGIAQADPNTDINAIEHHQPWPGGRYNHYLFDLNRDWAWQTQIESQHRVAFYQKWMPHVHVDLHEMGYNSPYFFAPAAKPWHEEITDWQRDFQHIVGKNNAKRFDRNGWLYYTKEVFDLLYPSYGDTWPTFNGAIGFTYEQGGSREAGLEVIQETGNMLTLKNRATHHFEASRSTIEAAFEHRDQLLNNFKAYFDANNQPQYSYIIPSDIDNQAALKELMSLLDRQQIRYGFAENAQSLTNAFNYATQRKQSIKIDTNDLIINTQQPLGKLVKILFEPYTQLEDSLTYDMTAWAIPYIYNVNAYMVNQIVNHNTAGAKQFKHLQLEQNAPYAVAINYTDVADAKVLGELLKAGLVVRTATQPFMANDRDFDRGTLIITKGDNQSRFYRYDEAILAITNRYQKSVAFINSGMVQKGHDLGSDWVKYLATPKVAVIGGEGISPTSYGEVLDYFDNEIEYPITALRTDYLSRVNLSKYNVVILPSGNYRAHMSKILSYVQNGGRVIALERAASLLAEQSKTSVKLQGYVTFSDENILYDQRERASISSMVAGSIFRVQLDPTHPLAFGYDDELYLLKRNSNIFAPLQGDGWTVGRFSGNAHVSGFVGANLKKHIPNTAAIITENYGSGAIVYFPDSPIFRGFWHGGKLLMGNAVFMRF